MALDPALHQLPTTGVGESRVEQVQDTAFGDGAIEIAEYGEPSPWW